MKTQERDVLRLHQCDGSHHAYWPPVGKLDSERSRPTRRAQPSERSGSRRTWPIVTRAAGVVAVTRLVRARPNPLRWYLPVGAVAAAALLLLSWTGPRRADAARLP
jgi:hypothetical protein